MPSHSRSIFRTDALQCRSGALRKTSVPGRLATATGRAPAAISPQAGATWDELEQLSEAELDEERKFGALKRRRGKNAVAAAPPSSGGGGRHQAGAVSEMLFRM
jgi:hypothetical protein